MLFVVLLIDLSPIQNYLAKEATKILSNKLKTKVSVARVRVDILNHFLVQGVYIADEWNDTLLYAGEVQVRITDWFFLSHKVPVLHYIGLEDAYVHLYRKANGAGWNYDSLAAILSKPDQKTDTASSPLEFDLKKVAIGNTRFYMDDAWIGFNTDYAVGRLNLDAKALNFDKKQMDIDQIAIDGARVDLNVYQGGRPDSLKPKYVHYIDTTPFNPGKWMLKIKELSVKNSHFGDDMAFGKDDVKIVAGEFNPMHIKIDKVLVGAKDITIVGDTIKGLVYRLYAEERSGVKIKEMRAKVIVSPNESTCKELFLKTNNSVIGNYYSMRYRHFPDFTEYIDSVVMEGRIKDASVDFKDIAYFAPQLKNFPVHVVHISGYGKGSVANMAGKNILVNSGTDIVKGDFKMKGLPDIYKTSISYTNGEIISSWVSLLHYLPALKDISQYTGTGPGILYFKGNYSGFIDKFTVKGALHSNLGVLQSDIFLSLPGFNMNKASYSGTINAENFDLGAILKGSKLGNSSFKAQVNGTSFNSTIAQVKLDADFSELNYLGFSFKNLSAQGTLSKKQFNGTLQVDDPNLALGFHGALDFSGDMMRINAKANLLNSDFKALGFSKDSLKLVADFDLNCTGSGIDDFAGYAKLYNINLKRNRTRLDLDSVWVTSKRYETNKLISIRSNDFVANIKGNFQLTKLYTSLQYYLSKYIPNYIKAPTQKAPDQNISFDIETRSINNLLAVVSKDIKGFDNCTISGSLNTDQQKILLKANIPYAKAGNLSFFNAHINGDGNNTLLEMNTSIDRVMVGDSFLNGSLSVTATLAKDTFDYTIATEAPDANSSVALNGQAFASKDSLFFSLQPSQFYLSKARWDIPAGSRIVLSKDYLLIRNLAMKSGLQRIEIATNNFISDESVGIIINNINLNELGSWAGLAIYQPAGKLNGSINIDHVFKGFYLSSKLKAQDVKLGQDTLGEINISGTYDGKRKLVYLDPQTGVSRNNTGINVFGNISFDSTSEESINGKIQFSNTPISWFNTFLDGFLSKLNGTLDGTIAIGGKSFAPNIDGDVKLNNAKMHVDFLGTNYQIQTANIHVDEKKISFGTVNITDAYKNKAVLSGQFVHNHFRNMEMQLKMRSDKFEVFNLQDYENPFFYGHLIAKVDPVSISGPFNNVNIDIANAVPVAKSTISIPIIYSKDVGTYSYVSFKSNQTTLVKNKTEKGNKFALNLQANLNPLAEVNLVMDKNTGDAIRAKGNGDLKLEIPANNDVRVYGNYNIDEGDYTFTFKQLLSLKKKFILNPGSKIDFRGPIAQTNLDINATYTTHTRLYDLLSDQEKAQLSKDDASDARLAQDVNIILFMKGTLNNQKLSFKIQLPETRSIGKTAYYKLERINQDDRQLFDQVASLLIIGDFISTEGIAGTTATTGAINNVSEILSHTASNQLTNLLNKVTGNKDIAIDMKYTQYNLSDPILSTALNRNQLSIGLRKPYFHDRVIVEVGGQSDWGKPTTTNASNSFNLVGNFRMQLLLNPSGGLRLNLFRVSDYDATIDKDIIRSGGGISWRKSFDNFSEFIHSSKYFERQKLKLEQLKKPAVDSTTHPANH